MYYPYFRGKQYELIAIRERAGLIAENDFVPIIEPVKDNLTPWRDFSQQVAGLQREY